LKITTVQQNLSDLITKGLDQLDLPMEPVSLYEPVRYSLAVGGKRIRPMLTLLGCGLCGGEPEEALPAALAVELLHNFTLLHDDIMDRAETRRGQPSVNVKWNDSTAILSGDVMFARASKELNFYGQSDKFTKNQYARINEIFLDAVETVCEGQAYDLEFESEETVSLEDYLKMIEFKTAALLRASLQMGGIVAGAPSEQLDLLYAIGTKSGIAFQIQDDLLDVVGDPDKFGKRVGGDIAEGKKTYLSILALKKGSDTQRQYMQNILRKKDVVDDEIQAVIQQYEALNVIEETRKAASWHYDHAIEALGGFSGSEYKEEISRLLNSLMKREH